MEPDFPTSASYAADCLRDFSVRELVIPKRSRPCPRIWRYREALFKEKEGGSHAQTFLEGEDSLEVEIRVLAAHKGTEIWEPPTSENICRVLVRLVDTIYVMGKPDTERRPVRPMDGLLRDFPRILTGFGGYRGPRTLSNGSDSDHATPSVNAMLKSHSAGSLARPSIGP